MGAPAAAGFLVKQQGRWGDGGSNHLPSRSSKAAAAATGDLKRRGGRGMELRESGRLFPG